MKRLFIVSGANGFLGSRIVEQLLNRQERVLGLIFETNRWSDRQKNPLFSLKKCDVTKINQLDEIIKQAGQDSKVIFIHTAGIISIDHKISDRIRKTNVDGTSNVIEVCKKYNVQRLVYTSSVHAITELPNGECMKETDDFDPDSVVGAYAKTKAAASQLLVASRSDNFDAVMVHPSGISGPGDYGRGNFKQTLLDYLNKSLTATARGGYNFVDVRDVAAATIEAAIRPQAKNQNYILSGEYITIQQIITVLDQLKPDKKHHLTLLPGWFLKIIAPLAEAYYKIRRLPPVFTRYAIYTLTSNSCFDNSKAKAELGFNPRPIKESIADAVDWYEERGWIKEA